MRSLLREQFFRLLHRVLNHSTEHSNIAKTFADYFQPRSLPTIQALSNKVTPYEDSRGEAEENSSVSDGKEMIFVTGRFRSGSTLLWNIFRQLDCCTSYYEPFNERRWFDPEARGQRVDGTHRGVSNYWVEYEGAENLAAFYDEDWIRRGLYMDGGCWNSRMKGFITGLAQHAEGRAVLQFNRIDFRLPWIRHYFPGSKIIHIYRHPREQWCSTLQDISIFGPEQGTLVDFASADKFYLRTWVNDLKPHFPFLADSSLHPYHHFYWLWKLSYLFGQNYAHLSLSLEDLVKHPREALRPVFSLLDIEVHDWTNIETIIEPPNVRKSLQYASTDWFHSIEAYCETVLNEFLGCGNNA